MKNSYPMRAGDRQRATEFKYRLCAGTLYAGSLLLPVGGHAADHKQQLEMAQQSIFAKEKACNNSKNSALLCSTNLNGKSSPSLAPPVPCGIPSACWRR
ncbi:hypothetical protein [Sodalis sp.]|uniref:hypothetical protein n=1 Tax=Sodalis sp. (in: enterobacteria) TaxID=1898979 RepID=UPI003872AEEF